MISKKNVVILLVVTAVVVAIASSFITSKAVRWSTSKDIQTISGRVVQLDQQVTKTAGELEKCKGSLAIWRVVSLFEGLIIVGIIIFVVRLERKGK